MRHTYEIFFYLISPWLITFSNDVNGQNLLRNGSFEEYSTSYCDKNSSAFHHIDTLPAINWYSIDKGDPEYYRADTVLNNWRTETDLWYFKPELFDSSNSIDGEAWMGLCLFVWDGYSERLTGVLNESLIEDSTYSISFYIRISEISLFGIRTIGIQFSSSHTSIYGMNDPYYSAYKFQINEPDIRFDISETCKADDWVKINGLYKAKGGEKFITIGYYYPKGFNWSEAFDKYTTWISKGNRNAYHASRKLVRRAPDLNFSSFYVNEKSEHEIAYYFIDDIEISHYIK